MQVRHAVENDLPFQMSILSFYHDASRQLKVFVYLDDVVDNARHLHPCQKVQEISRHKL